MKKDRQTKRNTKIQSLFKLNDLKLIEGPHSKYNSYVNNLFPTMLSFPPNPKLKEETSYAPKTQEPYMVYAIS